MTSNCQSQTYSARGQTNHDHRLDYQTSRLLTATRDQEGVSRNEDFMDPAFLLPYDNMYPSYLEVQGDEDIQISTQPGGIVNATNYGPITAANTDCIMTEDRNDNRNNETSYTPITRPWEKWLYSPPRTSTASGDQAQMPLAVWEDQGPSEEPFNIVGEVLVKTCTAISGERLEENSGGGERMRRSKRCTGMV